MKVLFVMRHSGYVRNFESTLRLLSERGHKVELAFQGAGTHWLLDAGDVTEQLRQEYPRFSRSTVPERRDAWGRTAFELRLSLDYLRYLGPEYRDAPKLRARAERGVPPALVARASRGLFARARARRVLAAGLRALHRAIPCDPRIDAFLDARRPDVLVVTPLIQPGAPQAEYVRSARALGIRTALCVASWDNLTNKGVIHGPVDLVTVWNDAMKREAVRMHGVPPAKVVVTGAQPFDHWFTWQPGSDRTTFCRRVGLPDDRPYVLYLCSSRFVAPDEVSFVRRWLQEIRAAAPPALRQAGVLVRPHPQNADQWHRADLRDLGAVALWPPGGAAPADAETRADYFDSIYYSAAVVGVNTTAEIESAIVGRPVYTVLAPEFAETQGGTLHFHHLQNVNGGLLHAAPTMPEHFEQLDAALRGAAGADERCRRFVEAFVRPFGLSEPATPRVVKALEQLVRAPAPAPARPPRWAPLVQPSLARRGEALLRDELPVTERKAIREAARARTLATADAPAPPKAWKAVVDSFLALDYRDRNRFARAVRHEMPGEVLVGDLKPERLDYPGADIYLRVTSKDERFRLKACAKEPFTIEWIHAWMQPGEVFYDIGANVGVYSLVAACRQDAGVRVYSFEPSLQNVASLAANIVLNDAAERITPIPVALTDTTGLSSFALRALVPGSARHSLGDEESPEEGPSLYRQPVLTYRLDDLVARLGLPLPNHVKLDVDGGELAVLAGASATLASPTLRSLLVEVSASLSTELTAALAQFELRLTRRINVQNRAGEARIWYGLFTRTPQDAATPEPTVEVVAR